MLDSTINKGRSRKVKKAIANSSLESKSNSWTIENSESLYGIKGWGEPYFAINSDGNIAVSPQGKSGAVSLDLCKLVASLKKRNLSLPILIRFPDILADRIARLYDCMNRAIANYQYEGKYQGVFPVKCNQNRHLLEAVVSSGRSYKLGLEAGSKPELIIALAHLAAEPASSSLLLMCNGYKDREYIETALLATKLGQKPIIIIEQIQELEITLEIARQLKIKPIIGVRAKLDTKGTGRWGDSTGDRAKFGLTISQILQVVEKLTKKEMLDCLQLLHFHIGSQISAISAIKEAIKEASQIYVELVKIGANMQYLNVGGGLAIDYDGSKSNSPASKNYNMQNYANDIVAQVKDACDRANAALRDRASVEPPTLISESGRAIASHQSLLIFDILETSNVAKGEVDAPEADAPPVIRNFWTTYQGISIDNYQESYNDAIQFKQEALSLFNFGYLSLTQRAIAEKIYWACCHKITAIIANLEHIPDEMKELERVMASIYYANLSIFQSAPDSWAIEQLFPIMPIHRLDEPPTCKGIIVDLTCDSDGKIDRFIDRKNAKHLLELHPLKPNEPYYLGMFLVGAYQEVMGNLHNLFGDTNVAHIKTTPQGYEVEYVIKGDTVTDVLESVKYDRDLLIETLHRRTEIALQEKLITLKEAQKLLDNYQRTLDSYTYLNS